MKRREFIALVNGAAAWPFIGVSEGASARGSALLIFERPDCVWCQHWDAEIAPAYPPTTEGSLAPLRRIHIRDQAIAGVLLERIGATVDAVDYVVFANLANVNAALRGGLLSLIEVRLMCVGAGPTLDFADASAFLAEFSRMIDLARKKRLQ